jgi:hypothetical protein
VSRATSQIRARKVYKRSPKFIIHFITSLLPFSTKHQYSFLLFTSTLFTHLNNLRAQKNLLCGKVRRDEREMSERLISRGVLTVNFCQPSHEFTFGVDINFISYPLVLTPFT